MIIDFLLVAFFLASWSIGWTLRIYIDWLRLLGVILFIGIITFLLPYFIAFVDHSSANFPDWVYYFFGIGTSVLIFLCFLLFMKRKKSSKGFRRFVGGMTLALLSVYALIIVLWTMAGYGWIIISQSFIFDVLPEWILRPI